MSDPYPYEDDYLDLPLDASTYASFDWDTLPEELVHRHDDILSMSREQLVSFSHEGLDHLHAWAAARRWRQLGDEENFERLARYVLTHRKSDTSQWLSYPDITLELARTIASSNPDGAETLFASYAEEIDHSATALAHYRGLAMIQSGNSETGVQFLVQAIQDHSAAEPELAMFYAESLLDAGLGDAAGAVIDAGLAAASDDADICRELEALRGFIASSRAE